MRYEDLETGHFFRIAVRPDLGEFFKCQPWASTTADLEKVISFKPDVEVVITDRSASGEASREVRTPDKSSSGQERLAIEAAEARIRELEEK